MADQSVSIRLAGTAVLLRNSDDGIEALLLRRNAKLAFAGGAWVFPGGAIDSHELEAAASNHEAAMAATAREIKEECGLNVSAQDLVHFCNWTTPLGEKRRFATWFFVAKVGEGSGNVVIDNGEIHESQWIKPHQAINLHHSGELTMMPPTYLSLSLLRHYETAELACSALAVRKPYDVTPRLCRLQNKIVCLYPGDAGYSTINSALPGPRHRAVFTSRGLLYDHSGDDVDVMPMDEP
jgi:8-oxo-dGTP pyrophosphatase MutT (NUDIX family)